MGRFDGRALVSSRDAASGLMRKEAGPDRRDVALAGELEGAMAQAHREK